MPIIPQKCQYALRAVFELAKRHGQGPIKIAEVARCQDIPPRFLEVILAQLKQGRFVGSQRGSEGGYWLLREPDKLSIGEIIRFVQGPIVPVACMTDEGDGRCSLRGTCVFMPMWRKVADAITEIYDGTTFQDLVEQEAQGASDYIPSYTI
jgi:Rrf2 family protein